MIKITDILNRICELYDVTDEDMKSTRRDVDIRIPRLVFVDIAKKYGWTQSEIAKAINCSSSAITYQLRGNQEIKDTALYRRGYNSMMNKMRHDEQDV
jgi:chromosomal replication initiation ATPase DnaA